MYDWPELRADTDGFWQILRKHFTRAGFDAPEVLEHVDDETQGWLEPELLFSQTCGYPFISRLEGKVELLGTPHFDIEGWQGATYRSAVIVRRDFGAENLDDCRGSRFAFNSKNSLSGYRCMTPLTGRPEDWFANLVKSGGHRFSAEMVANGEADIAAIDAMCWHLFGHCQPQLAAQLRVLQWTPPLPGLPFITNRHWSHGDLEWLKTCLAEAISEMVNSPHNHIFRFSGMSRLNVADYKSIILL
jgi:ABC-type phosphate/phosphonate transport system substrate-binding protein